MAKHLQNASVVVVNNKQNKRHNPLVWVMVLAFAAVLGVGGTFAYLTYVTDAKTNVLSTGSGITAILLEEDWNNGGAAKAKNMAPSESAAKDPCIENTSASEDEYVAIELTFQKNTGSTATNFTDEEMKKLFSVYSIWSGSDSSLPTDQASEPQVNSDWVKIDASDYTTDSAKLYYYCRSTVAKGGTKSSTLFDYIGIRKEITNDQIKDLNDVIGTNWQIVVKGAAIAVTDDASSAADYITNSAVNWKSLFDSGSTASSSSSKN